MKFTLTKIAFLLIGIIFLAISCKKDSDKDSGPAEDAEGINQSIASDKLNSVETEKPPRSEKVETEITDENETFSTPENVYEEATGESQSKVELLINGATSSTSAKLAEEQAAFAWILASKNGTSVSKSEKHLFIFTLSGKYLKYNNTDNAATWGYYYLDSLVTKVGFDYKNGVFENKFRIEDLTNSSLVVTFKGDKLSFKPYQMEGVPSNAFTPKKNTGTPTTPSDTTTTEPNDTNAVTAPEFLKIVDAETIGNIDYFTIEGDVAGDTNSNYLDKLSISLATVNDTTPININLITARNFVSDTDTSTNPIILGGSDKNKFSGKIEIDNTQFPTPRSFTFRLQSDKIYKSLSYKFGSDSI